MRNFLKEIMFWSDARQRHFHAGFKPYIHPFEVYTYYIMLLLYRTTYMYVMGLNIVYCTYIITLCLSARLNSFA
jgi:hypothetical protein